MAFYSLAQGPNKKYRDFYLYHDKELTKEEFINKYNAAIENIKSYERPEGKPISAEEVVGELCSKFSFEELIPDYRIHCKGEDMKKVKELEDDYPS